MEQCWKCKAHDYIVDTLGVTRCWYPHCEALEQDNPARIKPEAPQPVKRAVRNPKEKA